MKKGKRIGAVIAVAFMLIVFSSCENMFISLFGLNEKNGQDPLIPELHSRYHSARIHLR